jgi:hypothetical protein
MPVIHEGVELLPELWSPGTEICLSQKKWAPKLKKAGKLKKQKRSLVVLVFLA